MMSFVVNRIKTLILAILNVFKRVLCIFHKRRRKPSGDEIITDVIIDGDRSKSRDKLVPWASWDEKPTVEDHIEQYRKSLTKLRSASEEIAHEPDFFDDMTPDIKTSSKSLKLNFRPQPSPNQKVTFEVQEDFSSSLLASPELGDILDEPDEAITDGWDADEDISEVLKQQRIEERKKRSEGMNQKKIKDKFIP